MAKKYDSIQPANIVDPAVDEAIRLARQTLGPDVKIVAVGVRLLPEGREVSLAFTRVILDRGAILDPVDVEVAEADPLFPSPKEGCCVVM